MLCQWMQLTTNTLALLRHAALVHSAVLLLAVLQWLATTDLTSNAAKQQVRKQVTMHGIAPSEQQLVSCQYGISHAIATALPACADEICILTAKVPSLVRQQLSSAHGPRLCTGGSTHTHTPLLPFYAQYTHMRAELGSLSHALLLSPCPLPCVTCTLLPCVHAGKRGGSRRNAGSGG